MVDEYGIGESYSLRKITGRYGRVLRFEIKVEIPNRLYASLRQENFIDKAAKWLGVSKEHQTRSDQFDDAIYIVSDAPEVTAAIVGGEERRQALHKVIQYGAGIEILPGIVTASLGRQPLIGLTSDDPQERVKAITCLKSVVEYMHKLAEWLPQRALDPAHVSKERRWRTWGKSIWISAGVLFIGYFFLARPRPGNFSGYAVPQAELFWTVFPFAVAFALLVSLIAIRGRFGKSRTHNDFIAVFLGLTGNFVLLAPFLTGNANSLMDRAEPSETKAAVISKRVDRNRRIPDLYFLGVRDWTGAASSVELQVSEELYRRANRFDSCLVIELGPGALEMPWIRSLRIEGLVDAGGQPNCSGPP